jgi:hypothetical protein
MIIKLKKRPGPKGAVEPVKKKVKLSSAFFGKNVK